MDSIANEAQMTANQGNIKGMSNYKMVNEQWTTNHNSDKK